MIAPGFEKAAATFEELFNTRLSRKRRRANFPFDSPAGVARHGQKVVDLADSAIGSGVINDETPS